MPVKTKQKTHTRVSRKEIIEKKKNILKNISHLKDRNVYFVAHEEVSMRNQTLTKEKYAFKTETFFLYHLVFMHCVQNKSSTHFRLLSKYFLIFFSIKIRTRKYERKKNFEMFQ